jgi:Outer membrane protein beta-barrel domain
MNKNVLVSLILVLFFSNSFAQKQIEYGFLTGININSARGENFLAKENIGIYYGKSIGGFIKYKFSKQFGIKGQLQYDQNGYKIKNLYFEDVNGNSISGKTSITIRNTYLNIPILGEYSFGEKVKLNINAGPFIGVALGSLIIYDIDAVNANGEQFDKKQKSDSYKNLNFGLSLGAHMSIPLNKKINLITGVKNNVGLSNIFKTTFSNNSIKLNSFSIFTGLSF